MPPKVIQDHVSRGIQSMMMDFDTFIVLYNMQSIQAFVGFRLYDSQLSDRINSLMMWFDRSLSFGECFNLTRNNFYKFKPSNEVSTDHYVNVLNELNNSLESLLDYIHNKYIEIDLDEYGDRAWDLYLNEIKD
jgi:hypothetical protein